MPILKLKSLKYPLTDASIHRRPIADVASAAEHNRTITRILQLPGEIRNIIYKYTIYPSLPHLLIVRNTPSGENTTYLPFESQFPALSLSIFFVSKQIRAEGLSHLCANKELRILGVDVANALFRSLGSALEDVKRLSLSLYFNINHHSVGDAEEIETFFAFLERMSALRYFKFMIGNASVPLNWELASSDENWAFLERVVGFVKRREEVEFQWCTGARDERRLLQDNGNKVVRDLLGVENEVVEPVVGALM